jgi:GNAT superfamily N-acetyltransferase
MISVPDRRLRVRPAELADAGAIGETHAAAWTAAYAHIFDAFSLARAAEGRRLGWTQSLPTMLMAPSFVLLAERDGQVVAFAHAGPHDSALMSEIHAFYVHPAAWGTRVAEVLMAQTCSALAADRHDVVLWTLRDAGRARRFYEKVGFPATGREKAEALSDWTSGISVERPAIELGRSLASQRITLQP